MLPRIRYEHNEHKPYHLHLLHEDFLIRSLIEQFLNCLSPFDRLAAFILVVRHNIIGAQFDHLLYAEDNQVTAITSTEYLLQALEFIGISCIDIPCDDGDVELCVVFIFQH